MSTEYMAINCFECGAISEDVPKGDPCPECDEYAYGEVSIEPCPLPSNRQDECLDENHHFGRGDHVIEVPE